jgi:hypothetical protein
MQYFFKGAESQFDETISLQYNHCKQKKIGIDDKCDAMKLSLCENILSFEKRLCLDIKKHFSNFLLNKRKDRGTEEVLKRKEITRKDAYSSNGEVEENIKKFSNFRLKQKQNEITSLGNLNEINKKLQQFKQLNIEAPSKSNDMIKNFSETSLLELNPEYIEKNFDSKPKSHWKPPKPVLLENFENSIGDQLKDISFLAT